MTPETLRRVAGFRSDGDAKVMLDAADQIERLRLEIQGANAIIAQERGEVMRLRVEVAKLKRLYVEPDPGI